LRRNFKCFLSQRHPDDAVDGAENQSYAGTLSGSQKASKPENDAALILSQNLDRADQVDDDDDDDHCSEAKRNFHDNASTTQNTQVPLRRIVTQ